MKPILLKLVSEIERLQASQDVLAAQVGFGVSSYAAQDAMTAAMLQNKQFFDGRKEIESLA
jgi:hypothetical protein